MEEKKSEKKKGNITRWWLQLQFAFFQDKRVRALRRKYGELSLIIYQKMMLKSLESSCRMRFEGLEDTFEEEIAVDIVEDESEKIPLIKNIMEFLIKHDLMIEGEDGEYYFPQAAKMCASETDSAERVRRYRPERHVGIVQQIAADDLIPELLHGVRHARLVVAPRQIAVAVELVNIQFDFVVDGCRS